MEVTRKSYSNSQDPTRSASIEKPKRKGKQVNPFGRASGEEKKLSKQRSLRPVNLNRAAKATNDRTHSKAVFHRTPQVIGNLPGRKRNDELSLGEKPGKGLEDEEEGLGKGVDV